MTYVEVVGKPCIVDGRACESPLDFWVTPDDGACNAIHMRCSEWLMVLDQPLPALRRILAAKVAAL